MLGPHVSIQGEVVQANQFGVRRVDTGVAWRPRRMPGKRVDRYRPQAEIGG